MPEDFYFCPRTRTPLRGYDSVLRSVSGSEAYPIVAGIPRFLRYESVEDEETRSKLSRLNKLARAKGWRQALFSVYGQDAPIVHYVTDANRASFINLLPLSKESDVLEIGPGLGQFTTVLGARSRSVWALEVVPGQAEFTAERCRQEGLSNVHVAAGGDDCRLPYSGESFDLVLLNLVFEWCASRCLDEPMEAVQRRLLSEIIRVLKRGGVLYLATKNRYALRFLLGKRDEHCHDLRFGSALPRQLAHALMRFKGHRKAPGLLHSYPALKAMLREAGFEKSESFWAAPEMRWAVRHVPTSTALIRNARREPGFPVGEMKSMRLIMRVLPARLVKYVTPGLVFLATKPR